MCRYADYIDHGLRPAATASCAAIAATRRSSWRWSSSPASPASRRYLDLAKFFIDERGQEPHYFTEEAIRDGRDPADFIQKTYEYNQAHLPVREQTKVVGHAVRAMYLYSGMADIATEYSDDSLTAALEALWDDLTTKQMYVTGGIGPAASNEGFTDYYDLPNESAYAETCASVGLVFWASRMLGRGPDRRYADIMEQALYNGAMSGLSLDGRTFFYDNPLESAGHHHRWTWHSCPCCPPNIARLLASIGTYMYAVADDEIAVHLYGDSTARFNVGGAPVDARPDDPLSLGRRRSRIDRAARAPGALRRLAAHPRLGRRRAPRGQRRAGRPRRPRSRRLCPHRARVADGDTRRPRPAARRRARVWANPLVRQDAGRVARAARPARLLRRGDRQRRRASTASRSPATAAAERPPKSPNSPAPSRSTCRSRATAPTGAPRSTAPRRRATEPGDARLVPYHLWDNRAPGEMLVWFRAHNPEG